MAQSHAVTCSVQGTYSAVSCMPCTDEETFNDVHPLGTTMSENGLSNKCPLKATNSDEKLKKAEESTQRPTTRPVVDKKGTPSKHEVHACKQVPPMAQSHAVTGSLQGTSDGQCCPCTECCGKDKMNTEPIPLKRKGKDSRY